MKIANITYRYNLIAVKKKAYWIKNSMPLVSVLFIFKLIFLVYSISTNAAILVFSCPISD